VIINVGRLIAAQDYPPPLRALALIERETPVKLLILGEGLERGRIAALVKKMGLQDAVDLIGFDSNPWCWMVRADLYVLSSLWEGHPNTLLEALALGCRALITSYHDSVPEMGKHLKFAVVTPGDPVAMRQAIRELLESKAPVELPSVLPTPDTSAHQYLQVLHGTNWAEQGQAAD
jgi:glycosyltransferase involved in cell wall biosynthesis